MIVSASRRTDIPAFFSKWFFRRLHEGFCHVRNPQNPGQVSLVDLADAEGFVFWTKNPGPMLERLGEIVAPFYFQYTVTAYGDDIERHNIPLRERIRNFERLAGLVGPGRVIWRYDPVLLTDVHSIGWHVDAFRMLASEFGGMTRRCVFSFIDRYRGIPAHLRSPDIPAMRKIAREFLDIARERGLALSSCAEGVELPGIAHSACVDAALMSEIAGRPVRASKDASQREACGCARSRDIGAYGTCRNGCAYCYAMGGGNAAPHDPESTVISGAIAPGEAPARPVRPPRPRQGSLL